VEGVMGLAVCAVAKSFRAAIAACIFHMANRADARNSNLTLQAVEAFFTELEAKPTSFKGGM